MKKVFKKHIVEHIRSLFRSYQLRNRVLEKKDDFFKEINSKILNELEVVLTLSTGRCGTLYLTKLIKKNVKNIDIYHKPKPEYFNLSNQMFHERFKSKKLGDIYLYSRFDLLKESYLLKNQFIETSCKTTFMAYGVESLFRKSKFIHIIRNPYDFCESAISRNYYNSHYANQSRIFPSPDKLSTWANLSLVEKNMWNWVETNLYIEEFKSKSLSPIITVRSEDLFKSEQSQRELLDFISVSKSYVNIKGGRKIENKGKVSLTNVSMKDIQDPKLKDSLIYLCNKYGYI